MLLRLAIKDYILIEELEIDFSDGLNVLTGETGAGKSIILGALRLALGARNSGDVIRKGAERARIQALFDLEGEEQIFTRELLASGRSVMKINDEIVSLNKAQELGKKYLSIHGQNDQQQLLDTNGQRQILDAFLNEEGKASLLVLAQLTKEIKIVEQKLSEYQLSPAEIARELDMIAFQINEIDEANLCPDDDHIEDDYRAMQRLKNNSDKIYQTYWQIDGDDNEESISCLLARVSQNLSDLTEIGDEYQEAHKQVDDISYQLSEIVALLERTLENNELYAEESEKIEKRLDIVSNLKKKYGNTIDEIIKFRFTLDEKNKGLLSIVEDSEQWKNQLKELKNEYQAKAQTLSNARQEAAEHLKRALVTELEVLNFKQANIEIKLEKLDGIHAYGNDKVDILIALNQGQRLNSLKSVASGGEISRIMLALKALLADTAATDTLIFDEIDSGISGVTASVVADKLYSLAKYHQIICITHLSQVALMADKHFKIEKKEGEERTISNIYALNDSNRAEEISRIIGGIQSDKELLIQAEKLLAKAEERKKQVK